MTRSQAGGFINTKQQQTVKAKTKAVHKEAAFRQVASDWTQQGREVQGLDVLERCKKLNAFLSKGLLGEVEADEELLAAFSARPKQHSKTATVHRQQAQSAAQTPDADSQAIVVSTPRQQPLSSRITAKESAALLQLLETDEAEHPAAGAPAARQIPRSGQLFTEASTGGSSIPGSSSSTVASGSSGAAAEAETTSPATTLALQAPAAKPLQQPVQAAVQLVAAEDDDLIGLLKQSTSGSSLGTTAPAAQDFRQVLVQQRAAISIQRHTRGLLVRRRLATTLQAATCLQALYRGRNARNMLLQMHLEEQQQQVRQHMEQPLQQQPQQKPTVYCKQESIEAAWRGYYQRHGPQAVCTVQRYWRGYRARRLYKQRQAAAAVLQACCRGWLVRQATADLLRARLQEQQHKKQQQQELNMQRQQRREAAVVLQTLCRAWLARRQLQHLAAQSEAAQAAAATAAAPAAKAAHPVVAEESDSILRAWENVGESESSCDSMIEAVREATADNGIELVSSGSSSVSSSRCSSGKAGADRSITGRPSDTSRSSMPADAQVSRTGSSSSSSSKLATAPRSSHASRRSSSSNMGQQPLPARPPGVPAAGHAEVRSSTPRRSGSRRQTADAVAAGAADAHADVLAGRHLVIRSAADMRTATQHGDGSSSVGAACSEQLARELVWRAEELKACEAQQQALLALRTSMAGSNFRQLQEAMAAVKSSRDTSS